MVKLVNLELVDSRHTCDRWAAGHQMPMGGKWELACFGRALRDM